MITKKHLKDNEYPDISCYYSHIVNCFTNGFIDQMYSLVVELSKKQIRDFYDWLDIEDDSCLEIKEMALKLLRETSTKDQLINLYK